MGRHIVEDHRLGLRRKRPEVLGPLHPANHFEPGFAIGSRLHDEFRGVALGAVLLYDLPVFFDVEVSFRIERSFVRISRRCRE